MRCFPSIFLVPFWGGSKCGASGAQQNCVCLKFCVYILYTNKYSDSKCFQDVSATLCVCVFYNLDFSRCFNDVSLVILIHHPPFCWSHTYPSALTELESQTSKVQGLKCMFKTCEIVEDSGKRHVSAFNSLVPEVIIFFAFRRYKLEGRLIYCFPDFWTHFISPVWFPGTDGGFLTPILYPGWSGLCPIENPCIKLQVGFCRDGISFPSEPRKRKWRTPTKTIEIILEVI